MKTAGYVERLQDANVLTVAAELGVDIIEGRGTSPGSFACPACNAETRHGERVRGACGVTTNGCGWKCFECQASGDAIRLIYWLLCGKEQDACSSDDHARVGAWVDRRDGVEPHARPAPRLVPTPPLTPPTDLVTALWEESLRVDEDAQVCGWLESKRIDANRVADMDLARALPKGSTVMPSWANGGQRLIVPLRDATGSVKSMKARRVDGGAEYKSMSPSGYAAGGLSFFDPAITHPKRVWIVEGEKKFLQLSTRIDHDGSVAVLGIGSGMYTPELIARIPEDAEIIIATDADPKRQAGAKYATDIIRMLTSQQRRRARLWNSLEVVGEPGSRKVQVQVRWLAAVGGTLKVVVAK